MYFTDIYLVYTYLTNNYNFFWDRLKKSNVINCATLVKFNILLPVSHANILPTTCYSSNTTGIFFVNLKRKCKDVYKNEVMPTKIIRPCAYKGWGGGRVIPIVGDLLTSSESHLGYL